MNNANSFALDAFYKHCKVEGTVLTDCDAGVTDLIIPEGITEIADNAFVFSDVERISFPKTLTKIGDMAFHSSSIEEITLPCVRYIGGDAFSCCSRLRSINLPETLRYVGEGAFYGSGDCESIVVHPDNRFFRSHGNCLVKQNLTSSDLIVGSKTGVIPSGVSVIDFNAFYECAELEKIDIPNGVKIIRPYAFGKCARLREVTLPSTLEKLDAMAFAGCVSLKSVTVAPDNAKYRSENGCVIEKGTEELILGSCNGIIPKSVKSIAYEAFRTSNITELYIPESVTRIDDKAFSNCDKLERISVANDNPVYMSAGNCIIEKTTSALVVGCKNSIIPDGTKTIKGGAFTGCKSLKEIVLPPSVTTILDEAFYRCTGLDTVVIKGKVTYNGKLDDAFAGCTRLKSPNTPRTVIGGKAYTVESTLQIENGTLVKCGNKNVERVILPEGITHIGSFAFRDCSSLKEILLPSSLKSIENEAFYGCSNLSNLILPDGLEKIGYGAFWHCKSLGIVVIPGSVKTIGPNAFDFCKLTSVTFKPGVEKIMSSAFSACNLKAVRLPSTVTSITHRSQFSYHAFSSKFDLERISVSCLNPVFRSEKNCLIEIATNSVVFGCNKSEIPYGVERIAEDAFSGTNIERMLIPPGVKVIESSAFMSCYKLTDVLIPSSVKLLERHAFYACESLQTVTIEKGVKNIEPGAFSNCENIKHVTIPKKFRFKVKKIFEDSYKSGKGPNVTFI